MGCGGTSNDNCTYFDSNSPVAGTCKVHGKQKYSGGFKTTNLPFFFVSSQIDVCPCNDNICQVIKGGCSERKKAEIYMFCATIPTNKRSAWTLSLSPSPARAPSPLRWLGGGQSQERSSTRWAPFHALFELISWWHRSLTCNLNYAGHRHCPAGQRRAVHPRHVQRGQPERSLSTHHLRGQHGAAQWAQNIQLHNKKWTFQNLIILKLFAVYVEASKCCNPIVFKLGPGSGAETGVTAVTRSWSIKVKKKL